MNNTFSEVKLFQVKPEKLEEFEKYVKEIFKLLIMPFDINCGNSIY